MFCNAETVVTDVALVMGFILVLFCVADCCAERRILGVFLIFLKTKKSQQLFYQSYKSVTQSKKMIQQCIFLTGIYLLVICMFLFFWFVFFIICFYVCCFFVEGKQDSR